MHPVRLRLNGATHVLEPWRPWTIGSSPYADIHIACPALADIHLIVRYSNNQWVVEDRGSRTGTVMNGYPLIAGMAVTLVDGAQLILAPDTPEALHLTVLGDHKPAQDATEHEPVDSKKYTGSAAERSWVNRLEKTTVSQAPVSPADERSGMRLAPAFRPANPGDSISMGRDAEVDILVDALLVSRHHARITRTEHGDTITDLGSTNGTWVNGHRISTTVELPLGAQVVVGGVVFRYTQAGLCELVRAKGNMSVVVRNLSFSVPDRLDPTTSRTLVDDLCLEIPDRSLVAVIGPSGAGKSTLLKCLLGEIKPQKGRIEYHGLELSQFNSVLSSNIGVVPQEDVLHRELTAQQVLETTAALRLPQDLSRQQRRMRVAAVLESLGLSEHAQTPVAQLSGGQRKRVSTAMELLTGPRYLFLDEPTSGLDPDTDFEVMDLLRRMAHGEVGGSEGSTVVVITHSTTNLDLADKVLVLAPGGSVAYYGDPAEMMPYFERHVGLGPHVRDVYKGLKSDPHSVAAAFQDHDDQFVHEPKDLESTADHHKRMPRRTLSQLRVLLRRQLQLIGTDMPSAIVTTFIAPTLLSLLVLVIPGNHGLTYPPSADNLTQPQIILVVILLASVALGLFPACRFFLDEKPIFLREARTGLGVLPYVGSKTLISIGTALIQSAILVGSVLLLVPHESTGLWGVQWVELWIAAFLLMATSWLLGFLISALVSRSDVAMNTASLFVVVQLIFSGGLFTLEGSSDAISRAIPTRWAYAAMGQSVDLNEIVRNATVVRRHDEANESTMEAHKDAVAEAQKAKQPPPPEPALPKADMTQAVLDPLWIPDTRSWWITCATVSGFGAGFLVLSVAAIQRVKKRRR